MDAKDLISSGTLELYVAGVLPPSEMEEVSKMASLHPEVAAEIRKIEEAVENYVFAHAKTPAPRMKDKILAEIEKNAPVTKTIAPPPAAKAEKKSDKDSAVIVRTIRTDTSSAFKYLAAACILLLLTSNVIFILKWKTAEGQLSSLISQNFELAQNYKLVKESYDKTTSDLAVATNPAFKQLPMQGLPISPSSYAIVYWNDQTKEAFIDPAKLPIPAPDKQYQLWALVDGKPVDAGVFDVAADKNGLQKVKSVQQAEAFAVTLEPKGGSVSPTLDQMYVMVKIQI